MAKQRRQVQIKICDNDRDPFIATLHKILLAPDKWDILFSINMLMNSGNTRLFHKGFCVVYFGAEEKNAVTLPHRVKRKHAFWGRFK